MNICFILLLFLIANKSYNLRLIAKPNFVFFKAVKHSLGDWNYINKNKVHVHNVPNVPNYMLFNSTLFSIKIKHLRKF